MLNKREISKMSPQSFNAIITTEFNCDKFLKEIINNGYNDG